MIFVEGGAADDVTAAGSISPVPSFRSPAWHSRLYNFLHFFWHRSRSSTV